MLIDIKPRIAKPRFNDVVINWSHPLSMGLSYAILCDNQVSLDLVKGYFGTSNTNVSGGTAAIPGAGAGALFSSNTGRMTFAQTAGIDTPFLGVRTIVVKFNFKNNSTFQFLVTKTDSNGASSNALEMRMNANTFQFVFPGTSINGPTVSDGVHTLAAIDNSANSGSTTFALDNVFTTAGFVGSSTGSGGKPLRIGDRDDAPALSLQSGIIFHVYVWSRLLSNAEVIWITNEPYAFFKPRTVLQPVGNATAGPAFRAAWALQRNITVDGVAT